MNDAYGYMDKCQSTLLIAFVLLAVFDMVEHSTRLTRLKDSFGVTCTARKWISSYLTDRTQFIHVGSESRVVTNCSRGVWCCTELCSDHCSLSRAFPQLPRSLRNSVCCTISMHADNTQLYVASSKTLLTDAVHNLQNYLVAVHLWFTQNRIVVKTF